MIRFYFLLLTASLLTACSTSEPGKRFSNLERIEGTNFVGNDCVFSGTEAKTDQYARSGKYSVAVNKAIPRSLNLELNGLESGNLVAVKVWRKTGAKSGGLLLSCPEAEIRLVATKSMIEKDGWEMLLLDYELEKDVSQINVFVENESEELVYFDDITVEVFEKRSPGEIEGKQVRIDIGDAERAQLEAFRMAALQNNVIAKEQKKYLPATLIWDEEKLPIQLRLKGDWTDHLKTKKWSFRIKVSGKNSFMGLKSFSIQHPGTRSFLEEWAAHQLFLDEDVLTTHYDFISVNLNGEDMGIYALEEHFDKQLLESKNRREGPILKFDEEGLWEARLEFGEQLPQLPIFESSVVLPFKRKRTFKTPSLRNNFAVGSELMLRYKQADENIEEIFDLEKLAKYYAICDLAGISHSLIWHNQRFYYNPVSNRLEPIAFDCNGIDKEETVIRGFLDDDRYCPMEIFVMMNAFNQDEFKKRYVHFLKQFSASSYVSEKMRKMESFLKATEHKLNGEFPFYEYDYAYFERRAEKIRSELPAYESSDARFVGYVPNPARDVEGAWYLKSAGVKAFRNYVSDEDTLTAEIALLNYHLSEVKVIGYGLKGQKDSMISLEQPIVLPPYNIEREVMVTRFEGKARSIFFELKNVPGEIRRASITKEAPTISGFSNYLSKADRIDLRSYPSAKIDDETKTIQIRGNHQFEKEMFVPKGWTLIVVSGTRIDLINSGCLISEGPVHFKGTSNAPISVSSSDGTGQGLTVLSNGEKSMLSQVHFNGLTNLNRRGWLLMGAVNFYQSDVVLEQCSFIGNTSEDGVNLIKSKVEVTGCSISKTSSDGIDLDFCTGRIVDCTFSETGNDCIDVSGSVVTIENCMIDKSGDKGISGGERSNLIVKNSQISNAVIGIAAKDETHIQLISTKVFENQYDVAVFQKKPEYGPAQIDATEINDTDLEPTKCLLDAGSEIQTKKAKWIGAMEIDIEALYLP